MPTLRALLDPLRVVPSVIADLTPLQLIGWQKPRLRSGRWNDAELLREATESLDEMSHAARADGVNVWARSGHRTLSQQRYLWNSKFRGRESVRTPDGWRGRLDRDLSTEEKVRRILGYTAFPGTSRHHWGTDVDMAQSYSDHCADYLLEHPVGGEAEGGEGAEGGITTEPSTHGQAQGSGPEGTLRTQRGSAEGEGAGEGAGEGNGEEGSEATVEAPEETVPDDVPDNCLPSQRWLFAHAAEYGWCRVYDVPRGGFQPEPWHWSYLPLAVPILARYLAEVTADLLHDRDIDGDSVVLDDFEAYRDRFLLSIAPEALPGPEPPAGEGDPPPEDGTLSEDADPPPEHGAGESPTVPVLP